MTSALKRLLVGPPIPTHEERRHRLPKSIGLAVFSSDAISSTAYATEEILRVLAPAAGAAATGYLVPISLVVLVLLAVVASSYRQTIEAHPDGGGSYIVSRENLGVGPSLVAGASLLVDYTLTVAVSVAAGVAAITSAVAPLRPHRVGLVLSFVGLIMLANLRGVRSRDGCSQCRPTPTSECWPCWSGSACGGRAPGPFRTPRRMRHRRRRPSPTA